jgi:hypothetical protein
VSANSRRPWLAVLLAFVYPGLGHVYLREWGRALFWFALAVGATVLLVPEPSGDPATGIEALRALARRLRPEAVAALTAIIGLSMLDAYRLATRTTTAPEGKAACPSCGRDVDDSLDFCHWCTEPLEERNA